jgi:arylsulfatase A-like enzyme
MSSTSARANRALDARWPTLAEALAARGYDTAGFVGNIFYGSARYGLARGFAHYHDTPGNVTRALSVRALFASTRLGAEIITWCERKWRILRPMQRERLDAAQLNAEVFTWLDRQDVARRPRFVFVNYFDAHSPYTLPGHAPQPHATRDPVALDRELGRERGSACPNPDLLRDVVNAYDDGIAWIDANLERLLRGLEDRGLLDNAVVIVTADHGEMLGEHGFFGHGQTLHREVVHVPLMVLRGGRGALPEGAVVETPVSVRDLPKTVLDMIDDGRAPPGLFPGRSLRRLWRSGGPAPEQPVPVLSELEHMPWMPRLPERPAAFGPMWLLYDGRYSYMRHHHDTLGVCETLYDATHDPFERADRLNTPSGQAVVDQIRRAWSGALPKSHELNINDQGTTETQ